MNSISSMPRYSMLPSIKLDTPKNMLDKASRVALPAIALFAAILAQGASADEYTDCIDACDRNGRDAHPIATIICTIFCLVLRS